MKLFTKLPNYLVATDLSTNSAKRSIDLVGFLEETYCVISLERQSPPPPKRTRPNPQSSALRNQPNDSSSVATSPISEMNLHPSSNLSRATGASVATSASTASSSNNLPSSATTVTNSTATIANGHADKDAWPHRYASRSD